MHFGTSSSRDSSLNSYTANVDTECRSATKEQFVVISTSIRTCVDTGEAVEVELPLKTADARLLEILWHDFFSKSFWIVAARGRA